ncbi:MAG: hypothetical protein M3Q48_05030 [Actinomycetota bacterium]|nr:hypothetical protein [Actinomycetota bacterium]
MTDPVPPTATVDRAKLLDALDTLADVALAIERAEDGGERPEDATELVIRLREIIAAMTFEVEASDFLGAIIDKAVPKPEDEARRRRRMDDSERLRQVRVRHHDEQEAILSQLASYGAAAPATCDSCGTAIALDDQHGWVHTTDAPDCRLGPVPADRRADLQLRLRVDPDGHPLVWADEAEHTVMVLFGEKGAGVAGITATVSFPVVAVRRWFTELLQGLRRVLAEQEGTAGAG